MHCWLLFFAGATVYGMSRISEPQIKAVTFAHPINGRKLTGSVIREMLVNSEESCSFECVKEEKCISYNLKSPNETDGFKCQISTSDRFVSVTMSISQFSLIHPVKRGEDCAFPGAK